MGFQLDVMFNDSFMDDITYVRDVEVCVERVVCYIPGCIGYGSENFGLGSLRIDSVGLDGATTQFYSVAPYRFDYRFVDEKFVFCRQMNPRTVNVTFVVVAVGHVLIRLLLFSPVCIIPLMFHTHLFICQGRYTILDMSHRR
jgi:hypothetical protein